MANNKIIEQIEKNKINVEKKQDEIRQLKNKERELLAKQRKEEQKIRTRRLIQRGAILESINPTFVSIPNEQLQTYLQKVLLTETARKLLDDIAVSVDAEQQKNGEVGEIPQVNEE